MIHYPCAQGGDEWLRLRMGRPSASEFERIITPAKKETEDGRILGWNPTKGETRRAYKVYLLTEFILDMPLAGVNVGAMEHGHATEPKARAAYEMMHGVDVELCGYCTNDEGTVGASPDGFVGDAGTIELKSPFKPEIHCGYLLDPTSLVDEYFVQVQGQLYISGRKWTDLISYFCGMPMVTVRVYPDAEFQKRLDVALRSFVCELSDLVTRAKAEGWIKPKMDAPDHTRDWLTQEDVDAILAAKQGDYGRQETRIG